MFDRHIFVFNYLYSNFKMGTDSYWIVSITLLLLTLTAGAREILTTEKNVRVILLSSWKIVAVLVVAAIIGAACSFIPYINLYALITLAVTLIFRKEVRIRQDEYNEYKLQGNT